MNLPPILPQLPPTSRIKSRAQGVFVIISALVVGALSWIVLERLGGYLSSEDYRNAVDEPSQLAATLVSYRIFPALACIPAIILGIAVFKGGRLRLLWLTLAMLLICIPLVATLLGFVSFLAPLYTYQEL